MVTTSLQALQRGDGSRMEEGGSALTGIKQCKRWQAAFYSSLIETPFQSSLEVLSRKRNVSAVQESRRLAECSKPLMRGKSIDRELESQGQLP